MLMVQVELPANVVPQVPPDLENGASTVTLIPVTELAVLFCKVRVCAALVVPWTTFVNASEVGETPSGGGGNSMAPTSTGLLFVFLGLPKKSVFGAAVYSTVPVGM